MQAALAAAAIWFVAAAIAALSRTPPQPGLADIAGIAAALLPPLVLGLFAAALLPSAGQSLELPDLEPRVDDARSRLADLHGQLSAIDTMLGSSAEKSRSLAETAATLVPQLGGSAEALEAAVARIVESGKSTQDIADGFMTALPSLSRTISEVDATLRHVGQDSAVQLRAVEAMIAAVQNSNRDAAAQADAAIANMSGLLTRIDEASSRNTAALSKRAYALDAAVDGVLERTTAAVDGIQERVTAQVESLRTAVEGASTQISIFSDDGVRVFNQRLDTLLTTSDEIKARFEGHAQAGQQLQGAIDSVLATMEARFADIEARMAATDAAAREAAEARLAEVEQRIAGLRDAGFAVADDIGGRIAAIDEGARQSALARLSEVEERLAGFRQSGELAAGEIGDKIAAVDESLASTAAARLAALDARIAEVRAAGTAAVDEVAARVAEIEDSVRAAAAERLSGLEQGFVEMRAAGSAALDELNERIRSAESALAEMLNPLEASKSAVRALDDDTARLGDTVANVDAALADKLATTQAAMASLDAEAKRLYDSVTALGTSVAEGAGLVSDASSSLAVEREALVALGRQLEGQFEAARLALGDIEAGAAAAAQASAAGLGNEFARIAEASDAAAGAIRATLSTVVDEAVAALDQAAVASVENAFGAPVRAQMVALEAATSRAAAAGQETAGRLANQMLSLVETISTVESRIGEVEAKIHVRHRDSMAARSMRIIDQLNNSSVEVARLLSLTVADDDWSAYLKGDRSVFARAVVPQLDREMARRMASLYQHDPDFRAEAAQYVGLFEDLIQRLLGDRDGEALAATMLSSDVGKIYVAIAEATERLPPNRSIN